MANNPLRRIPSVHELLESPQLRGLVDRVSRNVVVGEVRSFLDQLRADLQNKAADVRIPTAGELADRIARWIVIEQRTRLRSVINATGVILHTGLGRSPLADEAVQHVAAIAGGYSSLEVDLETGERSQRVSAVDRLLAELTGAESALVVNNNAGATLLALAGLARGREVIVSRGQLVEIGGSYRLPDVMTLSGAVLREVGTTNRTRISDYADGINESTAALMRVHPSNYVIRGFTEQATLGELVALGRRHNLPVIDDIGSGALIDLSEFGLRSEPLARESIAAGAELVLFSGDKLLGGPQCGILVGRRDRIEALTRHPLTRALRVDKMTLAALVATLHLYREPDHAKSRIPLLTLLGTSAENLANRAQRLAPQLQQCRAMRSAEVVAGTTYLGGGSVPTQELPTWCVSLEPGEGSVEQLARRLRSGSFAVFGRIQQDRLLLDLRSVFPAQDVQLLQAVQALDEPQPEAQ
jgi:L-seryl-tRNA(Ser) seleniumtransferase